MYDTYIDMMFRTITIIMEKILIYYQSQYNEFVFSLFLF